MLWDWPSSQFTWTRTDRLGSNLPALRSFLRSSFSCGPKSISYTLNIYIIYILLPMRKWHLYLVVVRSTSGPSHHHLGRLLWSSQIINSLLSGSLALVHRTYVCTLYRCKHLEEFFPGDADEDDGLVRKRCKCPVTLVPRCLMLRGSFFASDRRRWE